MKKLLIYYSFIVVAIMTINGFLKAESTAHLISAVIFFPLFAYFIDQVLPRRKKAIAIVGLKPAPLEKKSQSLSDVKSSKKIKTTTGIKQKTKKTDVESGEIIDEDIDGDRRFFLKLIASAGAGLFFMSLFSRRAQAAFFGSVPGPGTVALKDSTGAVIDPAIRTPTDGYKITEIDDASSPAYYGFVDKNGAWFIMREDSSGGYRYAKGSSNFAANWANRTSLTYDYFDAVF
jgi:hypothetical protein